ncbi:zinc-dependent peptidase [Shewanella sp. A25]|nr:zinc-dependent peptidase [Shewanella shenzhenensis]
MLAILLMLIISLGAITWLLSSRWRKTLRRQRVMAKPFPKSWRNILKRRLPYFQTLPWDLQLQLKRHIHVFLDEKSFIGCDNLQINDEIRVTIAAQACLLLLNRKTDFYPNLRQILVYPDAFFVAREQRDGAGLVSQERKLLAGESWEQGQVLLSWKNTLEGAANPHGGNNVVIHEFAHQLDQEDGIANGAPILAHSQDYLAWSQAFSQAYQELISAIAQGETSIFDPYGATNPAEFFAVVTETFFAQPNALHLQYPSLYKELTHFYQLDPINWQ